MRRPWGIVVITSGECLSTDTAVCKHNAGPAHLALSSGETDVATATVTGNAVTGAVARGRRRHDDGAGTAELFCQ